MNTDIARRWNQDPKPHPSISNYVVFNDNPVLYSDPLGDTIRMSFRTGFLGLFGKKANLMYDEKNQRWNNADGSAYTGKTNRFSRRVLSDLKKNQENDLGDAIVRNLATDAKDHYIVRGDPNSNIITDPNIYYNGSSMNEQKTLEGDRSYYAPGYVVLGHEMAHKFMQNLGVLNKPWYISGKEKRGVDEYNAMFYENILRRANGLPQRVAYQEFDGVKEGKILDDSGSLEQLPPGLLSQNMSMPLYYMIQQMFKK